MSKYFFSCLVARFTKVCTGFSNFLKIQNVCELFETEKNSQYLLCISIFSWYDQNRQSSNKSSWFSSVSPCCLFSVSPVAAFPRQIPEIVFLAPNNTFSQKRKQRRRCLKYFWRKPIGWPASNLSFLVFFKTLGDF